MAKLEVVVSAKNMLAKGLAGAREAISSFAGSIGRVMSGAINAAKQAAMAVGLVGGAMLAAGRKAVAAYHEDAAAAGKLAATLKATGYAAGFTVSQLQEQASALQRLTGVGDETILSMQGILATFRNIKGDAFTRATSAILDMGAAMGKAGKGSADIEAAVIQVGKALNDPIAGMSALSRVGVQFTDQQKAQIKAMQESGDMAGAQAIILAELQGQFGGTAEAMAKSQHGLKQMRAAIGDAIESIGQAIVETEGFDSAIEAVTSTVEDLAESGLIELWAENIRAAFKSLIPFVHGLGRAFAWMKDQVAGAAAFWGAVAGGAGMEEALKAMDEIPKKVEAEKQARLGAIREERAARKKATAEREKAEMESAQAGAGGFVGGFGATEELPAERAAEDAKKTAEEIAQAKLDAAKAEEEIQERLNAQREQAEQAYLAGLEREIGKREKLAGMTVDQFIAERRADKDREKAADKEARRAKELQGRLDRDVKLARKDQEFMDARNAIQKAKDEKKLLVDQADVAKQNLEQMEKAKQGASEATLDKLLTEQQNINEKLEKLLTQG
jgi:hypothetical protein